MRIRNTVRRGDVTLAANGLVGVLLFVAVVSLAYLAVYALVAFFVLGLAFVMVRGFIQGVRTKPVPAPRRHAHPLELDRAAIAHRERMAAILGYDPYAGR
jgi:hypothetical protein